MKNRIDCYEVNLHTGLESLARFNVSKRPLYNLEEDSHYATQLGNKSFNKMQSASFLNPASSPTRSCF